MLYSTKSLLINFKKKFTIKSQGFTLVELLIVITIIAILSAIGAVIYGNVNARGRDAVRLSDLANLQQAILIATHDQDNQAQVLCQNTTTPCEGISFPKVATTKNTDGSGWVKVNFDSVSSISFNNLAIDPINDASYNYRYYSDGLNWKLETTLESSQYTNMMQEDGGTNPNKYEIGVKIRSLP